MMFETEEDLIVAFKYSVLIQCIPVVFLNISYVTVIVMIRVKTRLPRIHPQVTNDDGRNEMRIFHTSRLFNAIDQQQPAAATRAPR